MGQNFEMKYQDTTAIEGHVGQFKYPRKWRKKLCKMMRSEITQNETFHLPLGKLTFKMKSIVNFICTQYSIGLNNVYVH